MAGHGQMTAAQQDLLRRVEDAGGDGDGWALEQVLAQLDAEEGDKAVVAGYFGLRPADLEEVA